MKHVLLSNTGSDRATAYAMSNKIAALPDGYLCTWLDNQRRNRWGLVDRENGRIAGTGPLGDPCVDNHCGAALAVTSKAVHAIIGGHHSAFHHYRMNLSAVGEWQYIATIDVPGTYPSVTSDSDGRLHLAFRSSADEHWTLDYCGFENGCWSEPQSLVVAEKSGYIYWTNGLTVGPDDSLHLVLGNTRVMTNGDLYYGASHIVSSDAGRTWGSIEQSAISLPASVRVLPLIREDDFSERLQSAADQREHEAPGPCNYNYQQMLLSNPVVDRRGVVHVILHNNLTGTADLMSIIDDAWRAKPLTAVAAGDKSGVRIHPQSSLSLGPDGQLLAALMVGQTEACVWGPPGTYIVRVTVDERGGEMTADQLVPRADDRAQWLPAFEQPGGTLVGHIPPLLYTRGVNAGGFGNNSNEIRTEVTVILWE
ncbi:MAG: BNR repeat-containing protein [Candidatus Pacebacteria bacterium]|nr:BNR repeat-containing protein [Candidatus Paceibacterota bacterium]